MRVSALLICVAPAARTRYGWRALAGTVPMSRSRPAGAAVTPVSGVQERGVRKWGRGGIQVGVIAQLKGWGERGATCLFDVTLQGGFEITMAGCVREFCFELVVVARAVMLGCDSNKVGFQSWGQCDTRWVYLLHIA